MKFAIFDDIAAVSTTEWAADLEQLPAWRREKALRFHFRTDQILCAKSYLLLCQLLKTHYSIREQPQFSYGKQGKPFLLNYPHIYFNISHCKNAVLCVVADRPVGCDVETIAELPDSDFLNFVCNEQEKQQILHAQNPALTFYQLWTQKEAMLKCSGIGLMADLRSALEPKKQKNNLQTYENLKKNYLFSIISL